MNGQKRDNCSFRAIFMHRLDTGRDLQRGVWTKPSHLTTQKKEEHVPR